jgi:hypothetical protein
MRLYSALNPEPGYLDVLGHGSAGSFVGFTTEEVVASIAEKWDGQDIRLLSCQAGCSTGTVAQELADTFGVTVKAPVTAIEASQSGKTLYWYPNGVKTPLDINDRSAWSWYTPNR